MIKLITESGCDLIQEDAEALHVKVLPLHVRFQEKEYLDQVTLDSHTFYEKLIESDTLPKTSQVTPFAYAEAIEQELKEGNEVIVITLSSKLSGCYQSARSAAADMDGKVAIVDSLSACIGTQVLVREASRQIEGGMKFEELVSYLEEMKQRVRVIALVNTLEYLKKGGRISSTAAVAGRLLGIRPVITIHDGEVKVEGTARGSKNGQNLLRKYIEKNPIDFSHPISLAYSGFSDEILKKYLKDSASLYAGIPEDQFHISCIGAAIGTYIGPDAIGIGFFEKKSSV